MTFEEKVSVARLDFASFVSITMMASSSMLLGVGLVLIIAEAALADGNQRSRVLFDFGWRSDSYFDD